MTGPMSGSAFPRTFSIFLIAAAPLLLIGQETGKLDVKPLFPVGIEFQYKRLAIALQVAPGIKKHFIPYEINSSLWYSLE